MAATITLEPDWDDVLKAISALYYPDGSVTFTRAAITNKDTGEVLAPDKVQLSFTGEQSVRPLDISMLSND
jgi:hypothetical protein